MTSVTAKVQRKVSLRSGMQVGRLVSLRMRFSVAFGSPRREIQTSFSMRIEKSSGRPLMRGGLRIFRTQTLVAVSTRPHFRYFVETSVSKRKFGRGSQSPSGNRTLVACHYKTPNEVMCELRKRIVACAHDHDSITTTGQPDQHI